MSSHAPPPPQLTGEHPSLAASAATSAATSASPSAMTLAERRARPLVSRDHRGLHISPRALTLGASLVPLAAGAWATVAFAVRMAEVPATASRIELQVAAVADTQRVQGEHLRALQRDIAGLRGLEPRVQRLETQAAAIEARHDAAERLHDAQELRLRDLEGRRR